MSVRVGVVGAGVMGADHVNTLHRFVRNAVMAAVADVAPDRAEAAVADTGARPFADALALIADPDVDAVVIASHDSVHAEQVLAAVRAGKPVLCEKPLSPTLAEATRVLREIGTAQLVSLGFMRRFDPGYVEVRDAIDRGRIGAPVLMYNISRGDSAGPGTTSESSITGAAIHEFDVVPWLLSSAVVEISWTAPRCSTRAVGLQDPQLIHLRTADGVLSTVETFLNSTCGYVMRCEVVGETGTISLTEPVRVVLDAHRAGSVGTPPTGGRASPTPIASSYRPGSMRLSPISPRLWPRPPTASPPAPSPTPSSRPCTRAVVP